MKLEALRRAARGGIEPGAGVADLEAPEADDQLFPPPVQKLWDDIQRVGESYVGQPMTEGVVREIRTRIVGLLMTAFDRRILEGEDVTVRTIRSLRIEDDGEGRIDVVWPAPIKLFFEEQAYGFGPSRKRT